MAFELRIVGAIHELPRRVICDLPRRAIRELPLPVIREKPRRRDLRGTLPRGWPY
jgi:hypothetical protein